MIRPPRDDGGDDGRDDGGNARHHDPDTSNEAASGAIRQPPTPSRLDASTPAHTRPKSAPAAPAQEALDRFCEAWYAGERPDPQAYCREHPECGDELTRAIDDFLFVAEGLPRLGRRSAARDREAPAAMASPGRILGDYRILRELGRGGMGIVYEAEQISLQRRVALKLLPPLVNLSSRAIAKFHREAQAAGRQFHPGIVSIFAVGEQDGVHYIAEELVDGQGTLAERIHRMSGGRGPGDPHATRSPPPDFPPGHFRDVAALVADVADAVHHAHEAGVIHRDLKPSNILITSDGQPKVTDFGLARIEGSQAISQTGVFAGTPYYASPEQVAGRRQEIDARSDVYSLGVTLYEMLTLSVPFDGDSSAEVMRRVIQNEPRAPSKINRRIPRDLEAICLHAMEKRPRERYPDMAAFAADLRRYLLGEMTTASPIGPLRRLTRRICRRPAWRAATIVSGVAAALLVTLLISWAVDAAAQRRENKSLGLIWQSQARLEKEPARSLLLALQAHELDESSASRQALMEALACSRDIAFLRRPGQRPTSICFDPEGRFVAAGYEDGLVRLWNLSSHTHRDLGRHPAAVAALAVSPDGKTVASGATDGTLTLSLEEGTRWEERALATFGAPVRDVDFDARGRRLVVAAGLVGHLLEIPSGKTLGLLGNHAWFLTAARFSPTAPDLIVTAAEDGTVRAWDARTGEETQRILDRQSVAFGEGPSPEQPEAGAADSASGPDGPSTLVTSIAFDAKGQQMALGGQDGTVLLADWTGGATPGWRITECLRQRAPIVSVHFLGQPDQLLTVSTDDALRRWDRRTSACAERIPCRTGGGTDLDVDPTHGRVALIDGEAVRVLRETPGWPIDEGRLDAVRAWDEIAFAGSPPRLAALRRTGTAALIEGLTGEPKPYDCTRFPSGDKGLSRIRLSPNGRWLLVVTTNTFLSLLDLQTGQIVDLSTNHRNDINEIRFSEDGDHAITASADGTAIVWDLGSGLGRAILDHEKPIGERVRVRKADLSIGSDLAVTVTVSGHAWLWNLAGGAPTESDAEYPRVGLEGGPYRNAWLAAGGRWLATLDEAGACLWSIEDRARPVKVRRLSAEGITGVDFSPDRRHVLTTTSDGRIALGLIADGSTIESIEGTWDFHSFDPTGKRLLLRDHQGRYAIRDVGGGCEWFRIPETLAVQAAGFTADATSLIVLLEDARWHRIPLDLPSFARHVALDWLTTARQASLTSTGSEAATLLAVLAAARREPPSRARRGDRATPSRTALALESPGTEARSPAGAVERPTPLTDPLIVRVHVEKQGEGLGLYDPVSGQKEVLMPPSGRFHGAYAISPDGESLVLSMTDAEGARLVQVPLRAGVRGGEIELARIDQHPSLIEVSAGHVDFQVTQSATGDAGQDIYRIDDTATGRVPRLLLGAEGQMFATPVLHPDGQRLLFVHWPGCANLFHRELWLASLDPERGVVLNAWPVTANDHADDDPCFSTDGQRVYWRTHDRSERDTIMTARLQLGGEPRETRLVDRKALYSPRGEQARAPEQIAGLSVSSSDHLAFGSQRGDSLSVVILEPSGTILNELDGSQWHSGWTIDRPRFIPRHPPR